MMKKLLVIPLLVISQLAYSSCDVKSASLLTDEHVVGPATNLVETVTEGKCTVKFDINVNGKMYSVVETQSAEFTKEASLCRDAIRYGREKLLAGMGGKFQTEAITVCKEGQKIERKTKIGDLILENEVGISKVNQYFKYKGMRCRNFTDKYFERNQLLVYHGVICQTDNAGANWLIMDKW
jgi:hypothetical protein